jgi:hypothetical protein
MQGHETTAETLFSSHAYRACQNASELSSRKTTSKLSFIMKSRSILRWYRVLRVHYHWTVLQSIRSALWLAG